MYGKAGVADDTKHVGCILFIHGHGFLVAACQYYLGPSSHAQRGGMAVERLGGEPLALEQDVIIEVGQDGGIETDAVFHEQNHLHAAVAYVVLYVHLVLYEFDDGQDEVGIAQPAEHVVEDGKILVLHALGNSVREGRQHHTMYVGPFRLDVACHGEGVVVGVARHADDQVYVGGGEYLRCLLGSAHLCECRWIAQSELHILVVDFLFHSSVVLEHEGIVGIGNDEHVIDAPHHQVDKRHVFQVELVPFLWYVFFHRPLLFAYFTS